jgi:phage-related protein
LKTLIFVEPTREDLRSFPDEVQHVMGFALFAAQRGSKHPDAKPLRGFVGAGVLEVVDDFDGDTYRAVYTVKFSTAVYVLHVFQKKSKRGIETARQDVDLIKQRLKWAEQIHQQALARTDDQAKDGKRR